MKPIKKRRRRFFLLLTVAAILVLFTIVTGNEDDRAVMLPEPTEAALLHSVDPTPTPTATPTEEPVEATSPPVSAESTPFVELSDLETAEPEPPVDDDPVEIQGLVELQKLDDSFYIDLRYATANNFTGKIIYENAKCLIHKNTAKKLIAANEEFMSLGYRIKIFDAYRPHSAQKVLWDAASDKSYVASPQKGSIHNRGAAVDITLVDAEGKELSMPSGYDEFSKRAHLDYTDCSQEQIDNRELLGSIMKKHGFRRISNEWWHFEDTDAKQYPLLDVQFDEFK